MALKGAHQQELDEGERFQFGKNWARFLSKLTVVRIKLAEQSLRDYLQLDRLDGKSFLDVGSGSGLFSLAARRLGARVHSFDYDPQSVACTRELRRRYFPDDPNWTVEEGSALDKDFLAKLGTFDVVYSWGVLHHTGAMWQALENVKPLVPLGGRLFIAIYNDQGEITDQWADIKRRYNALPRPIATLFALRIIGRHELTQIIKQGRQGRLGDWLRVWTDYPYLTMRGMSRWHDWIDWIGGYPYERATIEQIVDVYARDGFRLTKLFDCSSGYGCNEFVFSREAPSGSLIETALPGGNSMARRFGRRVRPPFELGEDGWTGLVLEKPPKYGSSEFYLIRGDELVGKAQIDTSGRVIVAPAHENSRRCRGRRPPYYRRKRVQARTAFRRVSSEDLGENRSRVRRPGGQRERQSALARICFRRPSATAPTSCSP